MVTFSVFVIEAGLGLRNVCEHLILHSEKEDKKKEFVHRLWHI